MDGGFSITSWILRRTMPLFSRLLRIVNGIKEKNATFLARIRAGIDTTAC